MGEAYARARWRRGPSELELLTGWPAATVATLLRSSGIPLRDTAAKSPFMRRWREGG
jgi:hypothetical protein